MRRFLVSFFPVLLALCFGWAAFAQAPSGLHGNLEAVNITVADAAVAGGRLDAEVTVVARPGNVTPAFRIDVLATAGGVLEGGVLLERLSPVTLAPGERRTISASIQLPANLLGVFRLAAVVDSTEVVDEPNEFDNAIVAVRSTRVRARAPDLTFSSARLAATSVRAAGTARIDFAVANGGELSANVRVAAHLSPTQDVSTRDLFLGAAEVQVAPNGVVSASISGTMPATLRAGDYTVGLIADPDGAIDEVSETNNIHILEAPLNVFYDELTFDSAPLPTAVLFRPYHSRIEVSGGDGRYSFALEQGSALPPGLSFDATSQVLAGTPAVSGEFSFTLEVTSRSLRARRVLQLEVVPTGVSLSVVENAVPQGSLGFEYEHAFFALGGEPPYTFSIDSEREGLPPGLDLSSDGKLSGIPGALGTFTFVVRVEDQKGETAQLERSLAIFPPADVLIQVEESTPSLYVGESVDFRFRATGGGSLHLWRAVSTPPPGLELLENGRLQGIPTQVGTWPFLVEVRAGSIRGPTDSAIIPINISDRSDFRIKTVVLPSGVVRRKYEFVLEAEGGQPPIEWSLAPGEKLPEGFFLVQGVDGIASDAALLNGFVYNETLEGVTIRAEDAYGRRREVPMVIQMLRPEADGASEGTGCRCVRAASNQPRAGGIMALAVLLLVLLPAFCGRSSVLARRRRSTHDLSVG